MSPGRVWVLGLVVAGCFQPTVREGLPCDTECPIGQVCVGGRCWLEGTVPDAEGGTGDGPAGPDGPPGPDAPPGGHDEDGDGFADDQDGCRHFAESMQINTDGDGVNDPCDPAPGVGGEYIAYFDPFVGQRAEWSFPMGMFTYPGDTLEVRGDALAVLAINVAASRVEYGGRSSRSTRSTTISRSTCRRARRTERTTARSSTTTTCPSSRSPTCSIACSPRRTASSCPRWSLPRSCCAPRRRRPRTRCSAGWSTAPRSTRSPTRGRSCRRARRDAHPGARPLARLPDPD